MKEITRRKFDLVPGQLGRFEGFGSRDFLSGNFQPGGSHQIRPGV
jgi:hypothetical protein